MRVAVRSLSGLGAGDPHGPVEQPWWCGTSQLSFWLGCPTPREIAENIAARSTEEYLRSEVEYVCRNSPDGVDACIARSEPIVRANNAAVIAAAAEDPQGACEAAALQNYPNLSSWIGTETVCKYGGNVAGGLDMAMLAIAGAVLIGGVVLLRRN